ncbi:hypothetical protein [Shimia aestuarii]|uniref:hypothetical protein n=1 Tax=Shimia aestuarii TaxID=254406 RepID=UPI001FB34F5C|nr:hypothetical protein [Shimia aestuarii]
MLQDAGAQVAELDAEGVCVLSGALDAEKIAALRDTCLRQRGLMGQTRDIDHSQHLAGFHRFDAFAGVDQAFQHCDAINGFLDAYFGPGAYAPIGLSDITINRSQHWHTDLLRGPYARFLDGVDPWASTRGECLKALIYLQDGKSLRFVKGSHRAPSPLDDAALDELARAQRDTQLDIKAGDVVMMDIRGLHRGATDAEMARAEMVDAPKILLAHVFGKRGAPFAEAMEKGNAARMQDWDAKFLPEGLRPA